MKAILKQKYTPRYFSQLAVNAGEEFEVIRFPCKVTCQKGSHPYFVYGETEDGRAVRVPFSETNLNYAKCRREAKELFSG